MAEIRDKVKQELGVELVSRDEAGPLKRLRDSGDLVRFAVREGPAVFQAGAGCYTFRVKDLDEINLAVTLDLARRNRNPRLKVRSGRKSTSSGHATRQILEVKDTQVIEQALKKLVDYLRPAFKARDEDTKEESTLRFMQGLRSIDAADLAWIEGAGANGLGDWAILAHMTQACRGLESNTIDRYVGALRTLLDLAATHGFLLRRDVHGGQRSFLPAAWAEALEHFDRIVRESPRRHKAAGTIRLTRIVVAMHEHFVGATEPVDPCRLTEAQSISFVRHYKAVLDAQADLTKHQRVVTLATLRALMDGGVLHPVDITAFDRRRIHGRKNAFDATTMEAIAREFAAGVRKGPRVCNDDIQRGRHKAWKDRDMTRRNRAARSTAAADYGLFSALGKGSFFDPDNPYSLPRLVDWYTLTSVRHRERLGLSAVNSFPRENVRGHGGLSGRLWSRPTLLQHLELMGMYLGYLTRYHGVDLDSDVDARHLFTKELLVGFIDSVEEDDWTSEKRALDVIYHISMYTSPCWEVAALREGDVPQADAFQALSDYSAGRGTFVDANHFNGLTLHSSQSEEWGFARNGDLHAGQRRRALAVQQAYEKATGEQYAYIAMLRFRNAAINRFCRELGVPDLATLTLFIVVVVTSLWRKPLRLEYDRWRIVHGALSVAAMVLAGWHIVGAGYYSAAPWSRVLLGAYVVSWVAVLGWVRLAKPWQMRRRPWRVTAIQPEAGRSWTLTLEPDGHEGFRFQPGQFAWLFLARSPFRAREHPFSIASSAEAGPSVAFTIKELGDFTRTIGRTPVGTMAWLDGPHGVFTVDRYPDAPVLGFVAGGVGIAPIMSMLRTLADREDGRSLRLLYANDSWDDVLFRDELDALAGTLDLTTMHVIRCPPRSWEGESGLITPEIVRRWMPPTPDQAQYFLCGPVPMNAVVERSREKAGVPVTHIHTELFDMA